MDVILLSLFCFHKPLKVQENLYDLGLSSFSGVVHITYYSKRIKKTLVCLAKRKNRKRKEICIKTKIEILG